MGQFHRQRANCAMQRKPGSSNISGRMIGMADHTFKKIEVVGTSAESFAKAAANGVAKAGETNPNMSWFEVAELRGAIANGKISQYQVTLRIGCRME
jgi:dodecin